MIESNPTSFGEGKQAKYMEKVLVMMSDDAMFTTMLIKMKQKLKRKILVIKMTKAWSVPL